VISHLAGQGDFLLIDADSHASIYDACKMTQAEVVRFKHNDPSSLEARLRGSGDKPGNRVVVLEGIYSMLGDSAPLQGVRRRLQEIRRLRADRRGPFAGRAGRARPRALRSDGVLDDCHFIVGTFSKTLGRSAAIACRTIPTSTSCASPCAPTCSRPRCRPRSWPRCARRCAW
jgi:8-amino-7-oxononanoate synthase